MHEQQPAPSRPLRIFVCYRRDDAAGHAGRLYDQLRDRFGEENVFLDVERMPLAADFVRAIETEVSACDVVVAVVGRSWLACMREALRSGPRRDYVGVELWTALKHGVRVIPVLVDGASMPEPGDLPDHLEAFGRRNAEILSNHHWRDDVERFVRKLERIEPGSRTAPEPVPPLPHRSGRSGRVLRWAVPAVLAAVAVPAWLGLFPGSGGSSPPPAAPDTASSSPVAGPASDTPATRPPGDTAAPVLAPTAGLDTTAAGQLNPVVGDTFWVIAGRWKQGTTGWVRSHFRFPDSVHYSRLPGVVYPKRPSQHPLIAYAAPSDDGTLQPHGLNGRVTVDTPVCLVETRIDALARVWGRVTPDGVPWFPEDEPLPCPR